MNGAMNGPMNGPMNGAMNGPMNGAMNGAMNGHGRPLDSAAPEFKPAGIDAGVAKADVLLSTPESGIGVFANGKHDESTG
jgi:hypothetical protein